MLFFYCSQANIRHLERKYTCPISREDLLFTVEMALRETSRIWPQKHLPGDYDRLKPVANAVVEDMELCGMRGLRRPRGPGYSTPDPWGALRKSDDGDGAKGDDGRQAEARTEEASSSGSCARRPGSGHRPGCAESGNGGRRRVSHSDSNTASSGRPFVANRRSSPRWRTRKSRGIHRSISVRDW